MAEIRHLENQHDYFFCWVWSDLDKILQTGAEWHVDHGDMVEIEIRSRIPTWRSFGRIQLYLYVMPEPPITLQGAATRRTQCHVIPEPCVTLQGAATWWIQWHVIPEPRATLQGRPTATWWIHCHDPRATCHIAGCSHLAKLMSWSCHIAGCKNTIRYIENRFSP